MWTVRHGGSVDERSGCGGVVAASAGDVVAGGGRRGLATGLALFLALTALFHVVGLAVLFLRWCRRWLAARFFDVVAFVRVGDSVAAMAR
jgi:hypothetical protein